MLQLGDLRIRLDQMTERIISRLKDRSRFPVNEAVYVPDAVPIKNRQNLSFLEFALEGLEAYHASLGRYDYPDQYPLLTSRASDSSAMRMVSRPYLPDVRIEIKDDLLDFYKHLLTRLCQPGNDPNSYGETVYVDSDLLQLLNERINYGRPVAHVKADADPSIYSIVQETDKLTAKLKDSPREKDLIGAARSVAARYELNPAFAEEVFRWVIEKTLDVEIEYLQKLKEQSP